MRRGLVRKWVHFIGLGLVAALVAATATQPPTDGALARRLLATHALACLPQQVERHEDELRVRCSDGHTVVFLQQPMCDESVLCALGLRIACWAPMGPG